MIAIVDTGPLFAAADLSDERHRASVDALQRADLRLVVPALVIAEATYLIGRRLGPASESAFPRALSDMDVEAPAPEDLTRMAELVQQYEDFPLGGTDASIVALAERLGTPLVITLDRRHFEAVRPCHCAAFELLPS